MARLQVALPLLLVYLALSHKPGDNILPNLIFGSFLAYGVSWLLPVRSTWFDWSRVVPFTIGILRYALVVIVDMFKSAYQVALIVLDPKLPIKPGIIAVDSGCRSEMATALSAHAITLTPGEMVIAIEEDGTMFIHTLDITRSAEYAENAQAMRRNLLSQIVP
ncbi:MAG: Na+/H+ antiporter subunit E [Anaerolineales bacterium]